MLPLPKLVSVLKDMLLQLQYLDVGRSVNDLLEKVNGPPDVHEGSGALGLIFIKEVTMFPILVCKVALQIRAAGFRCFTHQPESALDVSSHARSTRFHIRQHHVGLLLQLLRFVHAPVELLQDVLDALAVLGHERRGGQLVGVALMCLQAAQVADETLAVFAVVLETPRAVGCAELRAVSVLRDHTFVLLDQAQKGVSSRCLRTLVLGCTGFAKVHDAMPTVDLCATSQDALLTSEIDFSDHLTLYAGKHVKVR
mmetsp:Transcript_150439/g.280526  ORF Transcript_150439/g.280526 Transcript_150439/m.280526 type:complete len:254 (-) Transcript_150439:725-1486(-)